MDSRNIWVYDLEIFVNFFSCVAINIDSNEVKTFVLMKDERNDLPEMYNWLKSEGLIMIGYNNLEFDYQLLHVILELVNSINVDSFDITTVITSLYRRTQEIINNNSSRWEKKIIPSYKQLITQIDLYKIMHFDNSAKATSLKWLEYAMRMESIQDLPLSPHAKVMKEDVDKIIKYNYNDTFATLKFFNQKNKWGKYIVRELIELRSNIGREYDLNVMNGNDISIGVEIFTKILAENMGISKKELRSLSTVRDSIKLGDCVLPTVKFKSDEFNSILDFFKRQEITETKGTFKDIPQSYLGNLIEHCAKSELKYESGKVKSKKLLRNGILEKLNIVYKGFQYDFGLGGIHGCIKPGVYKADDEYIIVDVDVASYYPNLAIKNNLRPEHLGESFSKVYESIYIKRQTYPKSNPNNAALKLALNGVFGKTNDEYSFLYDPKFTMTITINGQLQLCMLAEAVVDKIDDCTMLQINTDGLTVRIKRTDYDSLIGVCKAWEDMTELTLEYVNYESMIIRDVNNYIGNYGNGKYKHKGTFQIDREFHKNHSKRVVAIALHNYFIHDVPVSQTIRQHVLGINFNDEIDNYGIYDYCIGKKTTSKYKYEKRYVNSLGKIVKEDMHGKIQRYFVSNKGVVINKMDKSNHDEKYQGQLVEAHPQKGKAFYLTPFNTYQESNMYDINYQYYLRECNKVINVVESGKQTSLFV